LEYIFIITRKTVVIIITVRLLFAWLGRERNCYSCS